ncbi:MAG: cyclophilin-like fold protein [Candidatus Helarchaeota archaeon]
MAKVMFKTAQGEIIAELLENKAPKTVAALLNFLPMKYPVILQRWGEEIFFFLPDSVQIDYENAKVELEIGDVAFWPRDPACCIFFGKTPLSKDEKPVAAEPVNVFAKIEEGSAILPKLTDGDLILMDKLES